MKPKAFVIISPGFAANEGDTTCLPPMQVFVKALKKQNPGINLIIISFQYPFRQDSYTWNGTQVISIGGNNKGGLFRLLTWARAWRQLSWINKKYHVVALLSFWLGECALVGKYFAKNYRLKHLIWLLGQDARANNRYYKRVKPKSNDLIALSDFVAGQFDLHYGIRPAHTVPIGIETDMFSTKTQQRDIDVMGAGSLIPLKQYHLFIEAIEYVSHAFPDINAVICGDGPDKGMLQELIDQYGIQKNISLLGEIPHHDVLKLMQRSKVFLHPSEYEGYGAVISEALYAGAHVLSFCKPMDSVATKHTVATDINMMKKRLLNLLIQDEPDYSPVLTFTASGMAKKMLQLFGIDNGDVS